MRILFFDLEYASCKNGCKICEFGYVITNEKFEIIERNNLIINPYISNDEWDWWALKHILTRTKKEYENKKGNSRVLKKEVRYRFTTRPLFNSAIALLMNKFVFSKLFRIIIYILIISFARVIYFVSFYLCIFLDYVC